jgi:hypothetical protein
MKNIKDIILGIIIIAIAFVGYTQITEMNGTIKVLEDEVAELRYEVYGDGESIGSGLSQRMIILETKFRPYATNVDWIMMDLYD